MIGASIGDQSIVKHNFYHIESEAVGRVDGKVQRYPGAILYIQRTTRRRFFDGPVDWAGTGDTYFAQAAIPPSQSQGLEYRSIKIRRPDRGLLRRHYCVGHAQAETFAGQAPGFGLCADKCGRYANKDLYRIERFFTLREYDAAISQSMGREIDFAINFINYGWVSFLARPLSVPILYSLHFIYTLVHNYGVAIIIFTLLFYSLLFPLRWSQSKSFKKAAANRRK